MSLDVQVCYCFHVSRRKLVNFLRSERPKVASQLSGCGGAGTGCGWCVPFLHQLFRQAAGDRETTDLDALTPEQYARQRAAYRAAKGLSTDRKIALDTLPEDDAQDPGKTSAGVAGPPLNSDRPAL